jgi:iron complex transport system ATP-binding protein
VLEEVSLTVAPGEIVGLIGPNGAGKSTLLKTFAGILLPQRGSVELAGRPLRHLRARDRAKRLGFVPQEAVCHWPLPGRRVVELGRLPFGEAAGPGDADAIAQAIEAMDVGGILDRPANALSGGELRRLLLARALAGTPEFLLLDEPTAGLDPFHQHHLLEILRRLASGGCGIVVTLHDLSHAARSCDRLVLLKQGRVAASGTPGDVLSPERLRDCFGIDAYLAEVDGIPVVVQRPATMPRG